MRACVEWRILKCALYRDKLLRVGSRRSRKAPAGRIQSGSRQRLQMLHCTLLVEPHGKAACVLIARHHVVRDDRPLSGICARPLPADEVVLERRFSVVHVEIAFPEPACRGTTEVDLNLRTGSDRVPAMASCSIERESVPGQCGGIDAYDTLKTMWKRDGHLVDRECQRLTIPVDAARADDEFVFAALYRSAAALCHGPVLALLAIDRDVQRAMIEWVAAAETPCKRVIRREDAADEGDERDALFAIVAQRVDIPPRVAVFWNDPVEARSAIRLVAAIRPDSAAIGTPGPG